MLSSVSLSAWDPGIDGAGCLPPSWLLLEDSDIVLVGDIVVIVGGRVDFGELGGRVSLVVLGCVVLCGSS